MSKSPFEGLISPTLFIGHAAPPEVLVEPHPIGVSDKVIHQHRVMSLAIGGTAKAPADLGPHYFFPLPVGA